MTGRNQLFGWTSMTIAFLIIQSMYLNFPTMILVFFSKVQCPDLCYVLLGPDKLMIENAYSNKGQAQIESVS
jgi:hypothetical protein